jgi:hypothetical protein
MAAEWVCQTGALTRVAQAGRRRHGEVLLPQPGGFKGARPAGEQPQSGDPSIRDSRVNRTNLHSHRDGGTLRLAAELKEPHHPVYSVVQLPKFEPELVEVLRPLPEEPPNAG